MYPSHALREIGRLETIDKDLTSAMQRIDRVNIPSISLSMSEVERSVADAQKWIADAIGCLKIDAGIPLDD